MLVLELERPASPVKRAHTKPVDQRIDNTCQTISTKPRC